VKEVIILAGGLGTRLQPVLPDVPKCMAPINGTPFISYLINYLKEQGIEKFIFALGFKAELVKAYLEQSHADLNFVCSIEPKPLGTGGALKLAATLTTEEDVLVVNGDTFFKVNVKLLSKFHTIKNAACTVALQYMKNFDRYGAVEVNEKGCITAFKEKQPYASGFVNAGNYMLHIPSFLMEELGEVFSFENDYLEKNIGNNTLFGMEQDAYFIDIGIPEDFEKAQKEIQA